MEGGLDKIKHRFNHAHNNVQIRKPAEFEFHQERYQKMAEKARRSFIDWIVKRNIELSEEDVIDAAHGEALRDLDDFNKRQHAEFKEWQQYQKPVIASIKENMQAKAEGREMPRRIGLLMLGGGMASPYSAGDVVGFHAVGATPDIFEVVAGISGGAGAAAYFVAGPEQTRRGASLFYQECTTPAFINFKDPRRWLGDIMSIKTLMGWMSDGEKKLDEEAIRNSNTKLYFGVTRLTENGKVGASEFIDAKTAQPTLTSRFSRILSTMLASMSVPLVAGKVPPVNGIEYIDGAFDPMPVETFIDKFNLTDVLICPNVPFDRLDTFKLSSGQWMLAQLAKTLGSTGSLVSLGQAEKILRIKEQLRNSMEFIQEQKKANVAILWPRDAGLSTFGQDADAIKSSVYESARDVFDAFGEKQPHEIQLYETPQIWTHASEGFKS